jgi:hypothetical protein
MKTEAERFMSWAQRPSNAIKRDTCMNDITDLYTAETGNELQSYLVELHIHRDCHYASRLYEFPDSSRIEVSYKNEFDYA